VGQLRQHPAAQEAVLALAVPGGLPREMPHVEAREDADGAVTLFAAVDRRVTGEVSLQVAGFGSSVVFAGELVGETLAGRVGDADAVAILTRAGRVDPGAVLEDGERLAAPGTRCHRYF